MIDEGINLDTAAEQLLEPQEEATEAPEIKEPAEDAEIIDEETNELFDEDSEDGDATDEDEEDSDEEDGEENEEDEEGDEEPGTYQVKVDGQVKDVTLDELKKGFSGNKFVQQEMAKNADDRKANLNYRAEVEGVYHQVTKAREQMVQLLNQAQNGNIPKPPVAPDYTLAEMDPIGHIQAQAKYEQEARQYQQDISQFQAGQQQHEAAQKAAFDVYQKEEYQKLVEAIPDISDPKKATKIKQKLVEVGTNYGYSADEIDQIVDSRALRVLHDAARYRAIKSGKDAALEKAKNPKSKTKSMKAGQAKRSNSRAKARNQAHNKLNQTGSIHDAVDLLMTQEFKNDTTIKHS